MTWKPPSVLNGAPVINYVVKEVNQGLECTVEEEDDQGGICTAKFTELTNGKPCKFEVKSVSSAGHSKASHLSSQVVPAGVPQAPAHVTAQGGDGVATVRWEVPDPNGAEILSYFVEDVATGHLVSAGPDVSSHEVTGLVNRQSYSFR